MVKLIVISILVIILNIPFGYWRANVKNFSLQWVLAIHLPVILIISIRFLADIGFIWYSYIFFIIAFYTGQKLGSFIYKHIKKFEEVSSCLVMDILKLISNP